MTQMKLRLPFAKPTRTRRARRRHNDPAAVFKTFVLMLERLHTQSRAACRTSLSSQAEKA